MWKFSPGQLMSFAQTFVNDFANCVIDLYTGAQPANPSDPVVGTLIGTATLNGGAFTPGSATNGLNFAAPTLDGDDAKIIKPANTTWKGVTLAAGTVGWARIRANAADAGAESSTVKRVDVTVGITSGELQMSKITYSATGEPFEITSADIRFTN